jgi:mRNA interferase RelE/StbE
MTWELRVAASAERSLWRLPEKLATAIVEFMTGQLLEDPRRVGKPLARELSGFLAARRGPYRIVYRLDESASIVEVVRIDHRSQVYSAR